MEEGLPSQKAVLAGESHKEWCKGKAARRKKRGSKEKPKTPPPPVSSVCLPLHFYLFICPLRTLSERRRAQEKEERETHGKGRHKEYR